MPFSTVLVAFLASVLAVIASTTSAPVLAAAAVITSPERQRNRAYPVQVRGGGGGGLQRRSADAQRRRKGRRKLGESNDESTNNDEETGSRVVIDPFEIVLGTTPYVLDSDDVDALHSALEEVIDGYISDRNNGMPAEVAVDYVLLGNIYPADPSFDQTTVVVPAGVVHFQLSSDAEEGADADDFAPTRDSVNAWVQAAINANLVEALQGTSLYYVQSASVGADELDDEGDTTNQVVDEPASYDPSSPKGNSTTVALAASVAVAATLIVALGLFAFVRRRSHRIHYVEQRDGGNNGAKLDDGDKPADTTLNLSVDSSADAVVAVVPPSPSTASRSAESTPTSSPSNRRISSIMTPSSGTTLDDGTIAGSESEFTVNTETGDSVALKSLSHIVSNSKVNQTAAAQHNMVATESFERERHISLRKDMLTSTWSGGGPNNSSAYVRAVQNESVLTPSHFNASEERTRQTTMARYDESNHMIEEGDEDDEVVATTPQRQQNDDAASQRSNASGQSKESLIFEQANDDGGDIGVVLMTPPSQTTRYRQPSPGGEFV